MGCGQLHSTCGQLALQLAKNKAHSAVKMIFFMGCPRRFGSGWGRPMRLRRIRLARPWAFAVRTPTVMNTAPSRRSPMRLRRIRLACAAICDTPRVRGHLDTVMRMKYPIFIFYIMLFCLGITLSMMEHKHGASERRVSSATPQWG